jgi:hypothetical protein
MESISNMKSIVFLLAMGIIFCGSAFGPTLNFWARCLIALDTNNNENLDRTPASYGCNLDSVLPAILQNRTVIKQ